MEPSELPKPLLFINSTSQSARWKKILLVATVAVWLAYMSSRFLVRSSPWLSGRGELLDILQRIGSYALFFTALWFVRRLATQRSGSVAFDDAGVEFVKSIRRKKIERVRVTWAELGGYRDDSSEFIQLVKKDKTEPPLLGVPTPDENDRVRVLALLDAKGLTRVEG